MSFKDKTITFLKTIFYGTGKRDANGKKMYSMVQLALFIFLSAGIVFMISASVSYYFTRKKAMKDATAIMQLNMNLATEIINGHVKQAEISGYDLTSLFFEKKTLIDKNGEPFDRYYFTGNKHTIEEIYQILDQFMKSNTSVSGACIGFEPIAYPEYGERGIAPFVKHSNDTTYEWLNLPDMNSVYREKDWYKGTKEYGRARWSLPYKDVQGEVISTFCIPIYAPGDIYVGTVAMDLNLKGFSDMLKKEIHPYKGSEVMLIGPGNMFLVHPDQACVMECSIESIKELEEETKQEDATLFYHTMDSDNMIVAVSCPNNAIYEEIDNLMRNLMRMASIGLFLIEVCCLMTFYQVKRVVESKSIIEGELNIASNIQMSMLPMMFPAFPERNDLDLYATLKPAKSVGGDLYDYIIRKNDAGHDTLVFTIGDVSGKGIPASLLMAVVCSLFRNMAMRTTNPKEIATDINNCISQRNEYNMFCTMFVGSFDLETGLLTYCNAGHNQPVILKKGKAEFLEVIPNIPVGSFEGFEYESETMQMTNEDTLFIYTDGVTEAENMVHHEYSDERLLAELNKMTATNPSNVIETVAQSIKNFVGQAEQSDDITMLAVKINKKI